MSNNKYVKKAEEELEYLTGDEEARRLAYLREKAIRDEANAVSQGERKGKKEEKIAIAKKMLAEKLDIDIIMRVTELTKEEIKNL